jgi:hypothetical protein
MDYGLIYSSLIQKAKSREKPEETQSHHVTPRCMGGWDSSDNLVDLTCREHIVAHKLLAKIYPGVPGLVMAAVMMSKSSEATMLKHKEARRFYSKHVWNPMRDDTYREARRGEKNPHAKLTAAQVLEIRKLSELGLTNKQIANHFGTYPQHIYSIVTRRSWRYL